MRLSRVALLAAAQSCCTLADSEEAAPSFRFDRAPGFRDDLAPRDRGYAGSHCCHFVERWCQVFRCWSRRRLSPVSTLARPFAITDTA